MNQWMQWFLRIMAVMGSVVGGLAATFYYDLARIFLERVKNLAELAIPVVLSIGLLIAAVRHAFFPERKKDAGEAKNITAEKWSHETRSARRKRKAQEAKLARKNAR
jgi:hypothetical protein